VHDSSLTELIIGSAVAVHKALGPGLLESAYESCLAHELGKRRIAFKRQCPIPIVYDSIKLDCGYRADLIVERRVIVELKSLARFEAIHTAQILTHMKLARLSIGLLINFNVRVLPDGLKRFVL
jgi:GxxExxY protein